VALIPAQPQSVLQDTAPDDDSAGSEGESFTDGGAIPDVHQTTIPEQAFSPGISVTPTPYHEGDRTTTDGSGFNLNQEITIYLNNTRLQTTPEMVVTDSTGTFTAEIIIIPEIEDGDHSITAFDESGRAATTTITKE
jgi:hypothetical protein